MKQREAVFCRACGDAARACLVAAAIGAGRFHRILEGEAVRGASCAICEKTIPAGAPLYAVTVCGRAGGFEEWEHEVLK